MLIFQLIPKYQLLVLFSWCDLKDIAYLDSAICNRNTREHFLTLLRNEVPFLHQSNDCLDNATHLLWLWFRRIRLDSLHVCEGGVSIHSFILSETINQLRISNCYNGLSRPKLTKLINSCVSLTDLELCNVYCMDDFDNISSVILKKLKRFVFYVDSNNRPTSYKPVKCNPWVADKFGSLETFEINKGRFDCATIIRLVKQNPNITRLHLSLCGPADDLIDRLIDYLPHLRHLHLIVRDRNYCALCYKAYVFLKSLEFLRVSTSFRNCEDYYFHYDKLAGKLDLFTEDDDEWNDLLFSMTNLKVLKIHYEIEDDRLQANDVNKVIDNNCNTLETIEVEHNCCIIMQCYDHALSVCKNMSYSDTEEKCDN